MKAIIVKCQKGEKIGIDGEVGWRCFGKGRKVNRDQCSAWESLGNACLDKATEWMGDMMTRAEYTSEVRTPEDKFKVGATAHTSTHSGMEGDIEITESLENEKMTSLSTSGAMKGSIGTFSLKPTETGTAVTYVMDYEFHSILWKILDKLVVGRMMEREYEKALEDLKSILEQ